MKTDLFEESFIKNEIKRREKNAKKLAKKFKELKGLPYSEFLKKLPMDLDFVTATALHEALNT